jgi:cytosine/adenosine deaminase-related metal-dependent hydrolase
MEKSAILLVGNGRLVTRDKEQPLVERGCVAIQDGLIVNVGTTAAMRQASPTAQFIDAHSGLILPGLINAHMHLYSTFARGIALKDPAPGTSSRFSSACGGASTKFSPWTTST